MANHKEKRQILVANPEVNAVRTRYYEYLRAGYPKDTAAALAEDRMTVAEAGPPATMVADAMAPRRTQVLNIKTGQKIEAESGDPTSPAKPKADASEPANADSLSNGIPKNWQNLPWSDMRLLANQCSGVMPENRVEAQEAIKAALAMTVREE